MRTFLSLKTCLLSALLLCVNSISASKVISVSDFGLKPDSRINAVPFIQKAKPDKLKINKLSWTHQRT